MADISLLQRLDGIEARFEEVSTLITDPAVIADMKRYVRLSKEYKDLEKLTASTRRYRELTANVDEAKAILATENDPEMREMAKEQLDSASEAIPALEEEIKLLLIPADPEDGKNAILEIRGGTGGDEAAIFAGDLCKMYLKYCESKGWNVAITSASEGAAGGFKEVVLSVSGDGVYGVLKYESGVHRVQRVPVTETQGRVHTSTVTVAVLPEAETVDVDINEKDIKIDTYRSSGAGGQHINKTDSAIRITHLPTGIVVTCQDQRSQTKNKERAFAVLATKLYDYYQGQKDEAYASLRKGQVGTGDRSERIRTYNFPQGRVTDHRIGFTIYSIDEFMNGDLDKTVEALRLADQTAKLEGAAD